MTGPRGREPGITSKSGTGAIPFVIAAVILVLTMAASLLWLDSGTSAATALTVASASKDNGRKADQSKDRSDRASETSTGTPDPSRPQSPGGTGENLSWQTLSRIDTKIANSIMLLTLFVGIIAVLLGLYEYFKLREIERIRTDIKQDLRSLFNDEFIDLNKSFEQQLNATLLSRLDAKISTANNSEHYLAAITRNILLFYVINDLAPSPDTTLTVQHLRTCMELQRAIGQIGALSEEEKLAGLTIIDSISAKTSRITSLALMEYLVNVREMSLIRAFVNQDLCNRIIGRLEVKTGLSSEELTSGRGV